MAFNFPHKNVENVDNVDNEFWRKLSVNSATPLFCNILVDYGRKKCGIMSAFKGEKNPHVWHGGNVHKHVDNVDNY